VLALPLFPESLTSSVITTVWVGVWVMAFFALRFGWSLSGLVTPGYLTPLLLIKPLSAGVIFIEGVVTYLLVHALSERLSRMGGWSSLFGRDRFFALVLISVAVRLIGDGWIWPWVGERWNEYFQQAFDYRNHLYSFGLIIVSLVANSFWKTGIFSGLLPLFTSVGCTYLIVRYGLMEFTNFSIGNLSYTYDDLAASLLATPKAYIILLTTAWIASRMNLFYGWEFNGIMIPSLIALQWYDPVKVITSFTEIFIILILVRLLLKIPLLARLHLEGPRELLLFFNVSFTYKMVLGWLLPFLWPTITITDVYGFGYLLTSLVAMRMHNKEIVARISRATLQTSLIAVGIASFAGFALTLLPSTPPWIEAPEPRTALQSTDRLLIEMLSEDNVALNRIRTQGTAPPPLPRELLAFRTGIEQLRIYLETRDETALTIAAKSLRETHYQIYIVKQRYLYLRELDPANGWGFYVLDSQARSRLLVETPAPMDERGVLTTSGWLFDRLGGRALAVAGTRRAINPDRSLDVLTNRQTLFQVFHEVMAQRDVLQVRSYTHDNITALAPHWAAAYRAGEAQPTTQLWMRGTVPPGLHLARLKQLTGNLELHWTAAPLPNLQRESTRDGFAELFLNRADLRQIMARATVSGVADAPLTVGELRIDGYLQEWLLASRGRIAERGANLYQSPRLEELLYFDEEILTPLLATLRTEYRQDGWTEEGLANLQALAAAAEAIGYRLLRYQHRHTGHEYVLLTENVLRPPRYWGAYTFRLGQNQNFMVQIPHPLSEVNTFEYGLALFDQLQADVLLVAGAHPETNPDRSADVLDPDNPRTVFSLVNQVVLREAGSHPMLAISIRAYGVRPDQEPPPPVDMLITWSNGLSHPDLLGPLGQRLLAQLAEDGFSFQLLGGDAYTIGFQLGGIPQARYLAAAPQHEFCMAWLSPQAKVGYRQQSENFTQQAQFDALDIPTTYGDLHQQIAGLVVEPGDTPVAWQAALRAYMEQRDIVNLEQLRNWPDYTYQRLIDRDTQMAFLLVFDKRQRLRLVANLTPRQPDLRIAASLPPLAEQMNRFKDTQAGWLIFGEP